MRKVLITILVLFGLAMTSLAYYGDSYPSIIYTNPEQSVTTEVNTWQPFTIMTDMYANTYWLLTDSGGNYLDSVYSETDDFEGNWIDGQYAVSSEEGDYLVIVQTSNEYEDGDSYTWSWKVVNPKHIKTNPCKVGFALSDTGTCDVAGGFAYTFGTSDCNRIAVLEGLKESDPANVARYNYMLANIAWDARKETVEEFTTTCVRSGADMTPVHEYYEWTPN